jgi:hypothetical protein
MTTISRRTALAAAYLALPLLAAPAAAAATAAPEPQSAPYAAQQQAYLDDLARAAELTAAEPAARSAFSAQQLTGPVARSGFALYRDWLHERLRHCGLPALRLADGHREWVVGYGDAGAAVTTTCYELFRMISGRRSARQINAYRWTGDPTPYLPVISPYPPPA